MSNIPVITSKQKLILIGLTVLAVLFGLAVRVNGLGAWPLSVDEYYLTKSVLSILENGLPGFECGGYYTRGLLQQYVSAIAVASIDSTELAMRIYPLISSLIMLWAVFLLGKRAGGLIAACLVLALMSLSLWEIEYSRFARMYIPFQALTVIQVYLFVRLVIDGAAEKFKWMFLVFVAALFTYEGAIFLAALPAIAVIRERSLQIPRFVIPAAGMIFLAAGYRMIPFSTIGVMQTPLPEEVVTALARMAGGGGGAYPDLGHLSILFDHPVWLLALVVVISTAGIYSLKYMRSLTVIGIVFWMLALASFAVSLVGLGIAIFLCMILILLNRDERSAASNFLYRVVVPTIMVVSVFWVAFLSLNMDMEPRNIAVTLIKYPNISGPMLYHILAVVPVLMLVLLVPILANAAVLAIRRDYHNDVFVLIGGLAIMFYIGVALVTPQSFETRYMFFIFPLVVCLFSVSVVSLSEKFIKSGRMAVLLPLLVIGVYATTEDFDLHHYLNINTAEINYRTNYSPRLREHYKSRNDNRTPAHYINARVRDIDTVITADSAPDYYLDRVDYRYKNIESKDFPNHITCGLEHDRWSNAPVLYKEEQIDELVNNAVGDVWLVETVRYNGEWQKKMEQYEVFRAPDMRTRVLRMPAGPDGEPVDQVYIDGMVENQ